MQDLIERIAERVTKLIAEQRPNFRATYRIQLNREMPLDAVTEIVPYLDKLGVSHVYLSPFLKARSGSEHGYDVCDPSVINPELGGRPALDRLLDALRERGMGVLLDVVPNHMASSTENPWWNDVLENGQNSPYANFFDIDWQPVKAELASKVLLPILGAQYGEILESGQLQIEHREGAFFLRYWNHVLPLGPRTTIPLLRRKIEELEAELGPASGSFMEFQSIITALEHLPPQTATKPESISERQREKEVIKRRLRDLESASEPVDRFIRRNMSEYNGTPEKPESFNDLDALLSEQPYRLSHWRTASDEINYRRFFDINELAAVCTERPEVFHRSHELIGELAAGGDIDGLRIDHVDGLYAPEDYLWQLQWLYLAKLCRRALNGEEHRFQTSADGAAADMVSGGDAAWADVGPVLVPAVCQKLGLNMPRADDLRAALGEAASISSRPYLDEILANAPIAAAPAAHALYVVVEKILGPDEPLPPTWPVAGTTGYDFLNQLGGLLLEPGGWQKICRFYARLTKEARTFDQIVDESKILVLRAAMSSELHMLAHRLNRISEQHRRSRDFTLSNLRYALREILLCFPIYRVYPEREGVSDRDRRFVNMAVARAKRRNPAIDSSVFAFIRQVLLLEHPAGLSDEEIAVREKFTGRFQQVTSPVMAKGVEDTALYRYVPLASVNEVGGHPPQATHSVEEFHKENLRRREHYPRSMLATTTHDTKRSEDVRARVHVLSECPHLWEAAVRRWSRLNRRHVQKLETFSAPCKRDEYHYYQVLFGVWPDRTLPDDQRSELVERLQQYMEKAIREAKDLTSWINPDADYERGVREFVARTLASDSDNRFLADFDEFVRWFSDYGYYTALSQVVLKLASPGVPDIFQGQEIWDDSLVDPDNRRKIDYERRIGLLNDIDRSVAACEGCAADLVRGLVRRPSDPKLKLFATWKLLEFRRANHRLFSDAEYIPLAAAGPYADHVVAFAYRAAGAGEGCKRLLVVAPRFIWKLIHLSGSSGSIPCGNEVWKETRLEVPDALRASYVDLFTGQALDVEGTGVEVGRLLAIAPAAVLIESPGARRSIGNSPD